jgi:hypothetical protein
MVLAISIGSSCRSEFGSLLTHCLCNEPVQRFDETFWIDCLEDDVVLTMRVAML